LLSAQTPAPEVDTRESQPTFTTRSNLVLVRAVVRDKKGLPNGTLQKEDFQIFDKSKPQFISKFSVEKSAFRKAEPARAQKSASEAPPILPDRYVAYVFDDLHLSFGDMAQARTAAESQLADASGATTRAAIYTTSGQAMLDFTGDIPKLRDTLLKIRSRSPTGFDCPNLSYYMADLIRNKNDPNAARAALLDAIACLHLDPQTGGAMAQTMVDSAAMRVLAVGEQDARLSLKLVNDVVRRLSAMPGQRNSGVA